MTTYLNKAAILSEMGKHDRAIEEINKGAKVIRTIENEIQDKPKSEDEEL
ncbi:MAG: hypothetical protein JST59_02475 [Actinobacteria bacterium]|nr:hypothetical protein [Actinomycetota bacterium]